MNMPVALFSDRAKAQPVLQRLTQAGFTPNLNEGQGLPKLWSLSRRSAGVRLEVPSAQYNRAEQCLLDWDATERILAQAIRCPECGSCRVDFPQYARHSVLTNLALGMLASLRLVEKDYYCEDCHFTWPKEGFRARRNPPNSAPYYFIEGVAQSDGSDNSGVNSGPQQERKAA